MQNGPYFVNNTTDFRIIVALGSAEIFQTEETTSRIAAIEKRTEKYSATTIANNIGIPTFLRVDEKSSFLSS